MRRLHGMLALAALAMPATASAAEFEHQTLDDGSEAILILGDIEPGDEEAFRQLTIQYPDATVALDSDGGALVPALEIGRLVRLRNYTTVVLDDGRCVSSCALIWIAGSRRVLSTTASLGFHASYLDEGGVKVESGAANALVGHYLSQLSLSQDAVLFATLAPPTEVAWLNVSNRNRAGIAFETFEAEANSPAPIPQVQIVDKTPVVKATPPPIQVVRTEDSVSGRPPDTATLLRGWLQAPGFAQAAARGIGANSRLVEPMAEHLRLIYANELVLDRVSREIEAARIDIRNEQQAAGSVLYRLSTGLIYAGLQRLPQRDVNRFFFFMSVVTRRQDAICSAFEDTGHVNISEFEAIAELGNESLNEYLSLLRRAMFAEVENYPGRITLDSSQTAVAENAWAEVLVEKVSGRSQNEIDRLLPAIENFDAADPATQCEVQKIMIPAVSEMSGLAGDWFRRVYLSYIADSM